METLNSILAIGDVPTLFSNDEVDGLLEVSIIRVLCSVIHIYLFIYMSLYFLQALEPSIKRDFPSQEVNPMDYLTSRVRRNLHIIICLNSTHPLLNEDAW